MIKTFIVKQPSGTFVKDPQESELGVKIIRESIELLEEIGFEDFTFKKLSNRIESTEASVYRYFESKHQLLLYLYSWYWGWKMFEIDRSTHNVKKEEEKLAIAVRLLIDQRNQTVFEFSFNYTKLRSIIERDGIKSLLTKKVDDENQLGVFDNYKQLVALLSGWILVVKHDFEFPNMLVTTIIEGSHMQHFFSDHLPRLTNYTKNQDNVSQFYLMILNSLILNQ